MRNLSPARLIFSKVFVVNVGLRRAAAASGWHVAIELSILSLVCVKCGL